VHARDWVTWHGFALNVCTDLRFFDLIVPCGIQSVTMTSISEELRRPVSVSDVAPVVARAVAATFGLTERDVSRFASPEFVITHA
jgi:lipoyl(octanoyl) transferase